MHNAVLILELAVNLEELSSRHQDALAFVELGMDDDVGDAGFVFHGQEDEAQGRAGTLTGYDRTGGTDSLAVRLLLQFACGEDADALQLSTTISHRVRAG